QPLGWLRFHRDRGADHARSPVEKPLLALYRNRVDRPGVGQDEAIGAEEPWACRVGYAVNNIDNPDDRAKGQVFKTERGNVSERAIMSNRRGVAFDLRGELPLVEFRGVDADQATDARVPVAILDVFPAVDDGVRPWLYDGDRQLRQCLCHGRASGNPLCSMP